MKEPRSELSINCLVALSLLDPSLQVGDSDLGLLRRLVLPDGSTLRCAAHGRPTLDCLFADVSRDRCTVLKARGVGSWHTGTLAAAACSCLPVLLRLADWRTSCWVLAWAWRESAPVHEWCLHCRPLALLLTRPAAPPAVLSRSGT